MKTTLILATVAPFVLMACNSAAEEAPTTTSTTEAAAMETATPAAAATSGNIVTVAQGNSDFSTLVAAVTAADLGSTLSDPGPYTVFAPTNAAFEKIPQATRDQLMSPAGKQDLANILTYHVVPGETNAAALTQAIQAAGPAGAKLTTVNGAQLTATLEGNQVILTDAAGNRSTVTQTDVDASNGVIHVIDTVLMPE